MLLLHNVMDPLVLIFDFYKKNRGAQALRALDPSHLVTWGYASAMGPFILGLF